MFFEFHLDRSRQVTIGNLCQPDDRRSTLVDPARRDLRGARNAHFYFAGECEVNNVFLQMMLFLPFDVPPLAFVRLAKFGTKDTFRIFRRSGKTTPAKPLERFFYFVPAFDTINFILKSERNS